MSYLPVWIAYMDERKRRIWREHGSFDASEGLEYTGSYVMIAASGAVTHSRFSGKGRRR